MAKNTYSLDKGFLFPYSHAPILDALDNESAGVLIKACIKRQKDGIPFPNVDNPVLNVALLALEPMIQNRLDGQKGGNVKAEKNNDINDETKGGTVPPTVPPTVPKLSKDKLSKDKLSKDNIITPSISPSPRGKTRSPKATAKEREEKQREKFNLFWNEYPRKENKKNAFIAWVKLNPDEELIEKIMTALKHQKTCAKWRENEGRYIPLPTTWINGERWEDKEPEAQPRSSIKVSENAYDFMFDQEKEQKKEEKRYPGINYI